MCVRQILKIAEWNPFNILNKSLMKNFSTEHITVCLSRTKLYKHQRLITFRDFYSHERSGG